MNLSPFWASEREMCDTSNDEKETKLWRFFVRKVIYINWKCNKINILFHRLRTIRSSVSHSFFLSSTFEWLFFCAPTATHTHTHTRDAMSAAECDDLSVIWAHFLIVNKSKDFNARSSKSCDHILTIDVRRGKEILTTMQKLIISHWTYIISLSDVWIAI